MEVDIDSVQPDEKVGKDLFLVCRDISKEGILKVGAGGEWAEDGYVEFEGLGIDISDVYATGCGEEEGVGMTGRCNADVVFRVGWVREEGLHDEGVEGSCDRFDL